MDTRLVVGLKAQLDVPGCGRLLAARRERLDEAGLAVAHLAQFGRNPVGAEPEPVGAHDRRHFGTGFNPGPGGNRHALDHTRLARGHRQHAILLAAERQNGGACRLGILAGLLGPFRFGRFHRELLFQLGVAHAGLAKLRQPFAQGLALSLEQRERGRSVAHLAVHPRPLRGVQREEHLAGGDALRRPDLDFDHARQRRAVRAARIRHQLEAAGKTHGAGDAARHRRHDAQTEQPLGTLRHREGFAILRMAARLAVFVLLSLSVERLLLAVVARLAVLVVMCVLPAAGQPERGRQQGKQREESETVHGVLLGSIKICSRV